MHLKKIIAAIMIILFVTACVSEKETNYADDPMSSAVSSNSSDQITQFATVKVNTNIKAKYYDYYDPDDYDSDVLELVKIVHEKKYSEFSILKYNGKNKFKAPKNQYTVLYNMSDKASVGWGHDGTYRNWRLCYGLSAYIEDDKLYFQPYNDFPGTYKNLKVKTLKIESDTKSFTLKDPNYDRKYIDLNDYDPGLYRIYCRFSTKTACSLYFYIDNEYNAYTCTSRNMSADEFNTLNTRKNRLKNLIAAYDVTPENSLDISDIIYPVSESIGRTDTGLWAKLAHKITKDCKNDEAKVMAIHDWFTLNIIYDKWAVYEVETMRPWYYNDFSGKYNLYTSHTGKCSDFANAFVIMCRELGIPCNTIETVGHAWNIVYVDGQWKEIDLTVDINSYYWTEDMNKVSRPKILYCYDSLDSISPNENTLPLFINQILTDKDVLNGSRSYYDVSKIDHKTRLEKFGKNT